MKNRFKLLVLDIDGTLLNKQGRISEKDKQAIARAAAEGIQVSLASGRSMSACLPIINKLGLDGFHTTFDGALVSNPKLKQEVFVEPLNGGMVGKIVDYSHQSGINIELYSDNRLFIERDSWTAKVRRRAFNLQPIVSDFSKIDCDERIIKGTIVARSTDEKDKAEAFCRYFGDTLNFSTNRTPALPGVDFVNVLAPGVSKGNAIEALVAFLNISLDEVIAIGDGPNDASVLSRVGFAVAMGDASEELKSIANHVTFDAEHSGVAEAVNRVLFAL